MFQGFFIVSDVYEDDGHTLTNSQDPTKYQTAEDKEVIRKLIETYMTDKRTIIL